MATPWGVYPARLRSGYDRRGIHLRDPGAMESEGHASRKVDPRHLPAAEILSVQDHDVAQVALRIVDAAHDPTLVLGDRARLLDENRLQGHLAGTELWTSVVPRWRSCFIAGPATRNPWS